MNNRHNIAKVKAIEQANKKHLLAVNPKLDLKMGVKINGIQQTDDAVLYERALEIVKSGGVADD